MYEYKLMASALVFSVTLTLTGSFLTIEDWEQQNIQQKIEIIKKNTTLDDEQKGLLIDMLESDDNTDELIKLFSAKASKLRIEASKSNNPIESIQLKGAADSFDNSVARLKRIRGYEKSMNDLQIKLTDRDYTPEFKASIERSFDKIFADYEKEKGALKLSLVQGFLAINAANNSEKVLQEKADIVAANKPKPRDLSPGGPITIILGLLGSIIAGLKLVLDYKKARIELKLAELKLKATQ